VQRREARGNYGTKHSQNHVISPHNSVPSVFSERIGAFPPNFDSNKIAATQEPKAGRLRNGERFEGERNDCGRLSPIGWRRTFWQDDVGHSHLAHLRQSCPVWFFISLCKDVSHVFCAVDPSGHFAEPSRRTRVCGMTLSICTIHHPRRMLKLPLILTDANLYGGAIANFYWLTKALEKELDKEKENEVVKKVRALGMQLSAGYEADLKQIFGADWEAAATRARTSATDAYVATIEKADPVQLVAGNSTM